MSTKNYGKPEWLNAFMCPKCGFWIECSNIAGCCPKCGAAGFKTLRADDELRKRGIVRNNVKVPSRY